MLGYLLFSSFCFAKEVKLRERVRCECGASVLSDSSVSHLLILDFSFSCDFLSECDL
jgi:hypothetical protein